MEKIELNKIEEKEATLLRQEIQSALDVIKEKYKLKDLIVNSMTYGKSSFTLSVSGRVNYQNNDPVEDFSKSYFIRSNDLPEDFFERSFSLKGERYELFKVELKNPKYPVIAFNTANRKYYKFGLQEVLLYLGLSDTILE